MTRALLTLALLALVGATGCQRPAPAPEPATSAEEPTTEDDPTTTADDEAEPPAAPGTSAGGATSGQPGDALMGQASRPGGPADHDQCDWAGTWMGRFRASVAGVGDQVVTVHITTDNRWFVEADTMKTRGVWRRDDQALVIRDELAIGDDAGCADAEGRYVFAQTNDCQTAALSLDDDPCEARAARLHELVLERR